MDQPEIVKYATILDAARLDGREIERISQRADSFSLDDAYRIQEEGIRLRQSRGERFIGYKMGLTSEAKRRQMGLDSPVYGILTDAMRLKNESSLSLQGSIHPKIEPEIAFQIGRELKGRITRDDALEACTGIFSAMEILDSRYTGFKYFSLEDVVADNSSSSLFVLSEKGVAPRELDVRALPMQMSVNGETAESGNASAISGDPFHSIVQLCDLLEQRGQFIPAGSIILAGAATPAVSLAPAMTITLEVAGLQGVSLRITD